MLREILRGTGVALVTPFKEDKTIDFEALQAVINFVIEGGVQYVVTLGTTGETPTLSPRKNWMSSRLLFRPCRHVCPW
jgi:4-hydroxy-tetrahydrodipicolinate synthase